MKELKAIENLTDNLRNASILAVILSMLGFLFMYDVPSISILLLASAVFILIKALQKWKVLESITDSFKGALFLLLKLFLIAVLINLVSSLLLSLPASLAVFIQLFLITTNILIPASMIFVLYKTFYKKLKKSDK